MSALSPDRPEIVCLCGSMRFADEIRAASRAIALEGVVVLAPAEMGGPASDDEKVVLDALHLKKIDLADRVIIVNPGGYVGDSTLREIAYARSMGKPLIFTDPD